MSTKDEINKNSQKDVDEVTKIEYIGGDDYDGIKELDNRLPPWLKYVFYITIVFSAAYMISLWIFENDDLIQDKEYAKDVWIAEAKKAEFHAEETDKENVEVVDEKVLLADGKKIFESLCSVCHGKFGEGLVGPNFTDEYWIHGGSIEDMHKIVITGVIEKGMISYKNQLSEKKIQNVLKYIISLEGTNPPNQKAAEGEKYVRN